MSARPGIFSAEIEATLDPWNEIATKGFQHAILQAHGARSQLITRERVVEKVEGETVWEGDVLVFAIKDNPTAHLCYAWEVDDQVKAVLHEGPVDSPIKAVRAAILSEESDG